MNRGSLGIPRHPPFETQGAVDLAEKAAAQLVVRLKCPVFDVTLLHSSPAVSVLHDFISRLPCSAAWPLFVTWHLPKYLRYLEAQLVTPACHALLILLVSPAVMNSQVLSCTPEMD